MIFSKNSWKILKNMFSNEIIEVIRLYPYFNLLENWAFTFKIDIFRFGKKCVNPPIIKLIYNISFNTLKRVNIKFKQHYRPYQSVYKFFHRLPYILPIQGFHRQIKEFLIWLLEYQPLILICFELSFPGLFDNIYILD